MKTNISGVQMINVVCSCGCNEPFETKQSYYNHKVKHGIAPLFYIKGHYKPNSKWVGIRKKPD
jgi:hypothetical protein